MGNDRYKKNTKFYYLYCFDNDLRFALIKYIMEVEIHKISSR